MESKERRLSVFVCREEKLVFGLSKRTTCNDVVKVLLEDQNLQLSVCANTYCIVEKWRGFERILPDRTKMLRLWEAWGDEQRNVKFVLVRGEASMADRRARSAEARVVLSKHSPCVSGGGAQSTVRAISPEEQRRLVRKAFRKLEKINKKEEKKKKKKAQNDASSVEKMETLAHLVISQDLTLRQQIQRIAELDSEIESCEAKVHFDRMKRHGINYVQDTYLVEADSSPEGGERRSADILAELEEYVCLMEGVVRLQEELSRKEALVEIISVQMQEELDHRWMQRRRESQHTPALISTEEDTAAGNQLLLEAERLRTELDASSYISLRLSSDLEAVRTDLELTVEICAAMEEEISDLMDILETDGKTGAEEGCSQEVEEQKSTVESKGEWVEARGLSKHPDTVNDDDSDTGLSSLHSQDSDNLPVWESPV